MHEIARVTLENEMDLILAHKRSMKLAELVGLSLSAQTSFATAVSEVARYTIDGIKSGCLILLVEIDLRDKYIVARINDNEINGEHEGITNAKRLVHKTNVFHNNTESSVELFYRITPSFKIDIYKLDEWRIQFRNEPPVSPYEELKRKNEQLQVLSEKVQKSEAEYKILTNSLPMIIFSLDATGQVLYANEWLSSYTGETVENLNTTRWKSVVHEEDYNAFSNLLKNDPASSASAIRVQARLKHKNNGNYLWHQVSISPFRNENQELQYWIGYIVDIDAQKVYEETLKDNVELKQTQQQLKQNQQILEKYIDELNRSNHELQQFAYVASHDLQEPVRKIMFYSDFLLTRYNTVLDEKGANYLKSMQSASNRMRKLIRDVLTYSQINKEEIQFKDVDLNEIVRDVLQDLELVIEEKNATVNVSSLETIKGDEGMLRQLFGNLLNNSLKYSRPFIPPVIEVSGHAVSGGIEIAFKDNGIGFDQKYLPKMFTLFQRLHTRQHYDGTGLGLAICEKIMNIHQGKIWAEGKEDEGATFYISFPATALAV